MHVRVLGSLDVLDDRGEPVELRGTKLRTLLAALTLHAGQPVSADRLIDVLWGDDPPAGASNALQAQVSKLRRVLADVALDARDGGYVLAIEPGWVDAEQFTELARAGHEHLAGGHHQEAAGTLREALALWRGPALADFTFDEFAQAARTRLDEMRLTATEDRIEADLAMGRHEALAAELEGLVSEHPLREKLWAQLMVALYRSGRQSDSLRAYQRVRDVLADELGLEPGPALRELEQQVLAHDATLGAPRPVPTATPARRLSNIHRELSTFVGRAADVAQIDLLLAERRLVTLTGPGGVGKTRLAIELAQLGHERWPDGTWMVELGPETGDRAVASALARTFGPRLGQVTAETGFDWLTDGLAAAQLLVVFDNCEHVLGEAADAVTALVRTCPGVTVLATSREPLGVVGERVRVLQPLELDDAVQLFATRAADAASDFVLDGASAQAVTTICRNVDRLPLAIELTAARTRAFSAQQLAELVDHRFGLVSGGAGGRPPRQQTMHAAVDWSFDLLFDDERRLLRRLSVFAGGFTLDSATAVCADDTLPADDVDVLLARLVDKSLVVTGGRTGPSARFRLLRPVAEYAAGRLVEAGEVVATRARHTQWLIDLTAGLTAGLRGPDGLQWAHRANTELSNFRRAAAWGLSEGDPAEALQIGANLGWYGIVSANVYSDEQLLLELVERAAEMSPGLRSRVLMWAGLLSIGRTSRRHWGLDAVDVARTAASNETEVAPAMIDGIALTHQSIELARASSDAALLTDTLLMGGLHFAAAGSMPDLVRDCATEARSLAVVGDDAWSVAMATGVDGLADYIAGDLPRAMTGLREAIRQLRELGDEGTAALLSVSYSEVAELAGDIEGATVAMAAAMAHGEAARFRSAIVLRSVLCWLTGRNGELDRSLALGRELVELARPPFNAVIRAQAVFALGAAESLAGLTDEAAEHLREALTIHERVGMVREAAMDHRHLGIVRRQQGDTDAAIIHLRRSVELAAEAGLPWTVMLCARSLAGALVDTQPALACTLIGHTEAVSSIYGYHPTADERELVEAVRATATAHIGAVAVEQAMASGSSMSVDELPLTPS